MIMNAKVALRYTIAALAATAGAIRLGGWGWLLIWLAVSLAAQAAAYAGWGPAVFRKINGRLPWTVRIVLAPYMVCARITLHYYCRKYAPYAQVAPDVWIGRRLTDSEACRLIRKGVTAVVDLTAGFPESGPLLTLHYLNVQLLPLTIPTIEQLREAVRFIRFETRKGSVYVHGALGYSRSAGVVAAYLLEAGFAPNVEMAMRRVRCVTPQSLVDPEWMELLHEYQDSLESQTVPAAQAV
jgi:protein-tyrosine phosphatase